MRETYIFNRSYKKKSQNSKIYTCFKLRNAIKDSDEDIQKEKQKLTQHQHALNNYKNLKSTNSKTSTLEVESNVDGGDDAVDVEESKQQAKHGRRSIDVDS